MLRGDGRIKTDSEEREEQIEIVAYLDNGQWYFTPPNRDHEWESTRMTQTDLTRDYRSEITALNKPNCPLEIVDLHASLNKEYRSLLDIRFKLKNRTQKRVVAYRYRIFAQGLKGEELGTQPATIEPGGSAHGELDTSRYVFFCQGSVKNNLIIDSVVFGDGSTWELAGQAPSSK